MGKGIYAKIKERQERQKDSAGEEPAEPSGHSAPSKGDIPQKVKEAADLAVREAAEKPNFSDNRLISDQSPSESLTR